MSRLLRDRYAIVCRHSRDRIDGQESASRGAAFPRCVPQQLTVAVLCQNWKRAWKKPGLARSRKRRVTGRTWALSLVLFVRSGETRRAGSVYPPVVLQTKRTKAQFWARLRGDHLERSQPPRYKTREMMYTCTRGERVHIYVRTCMRACLRPWNTFTGFTASRHVYTMLIIHFTVLRYHLLRCLAVMRIEQERYRRRRREWEKEQENWSAIVLRPARLAIVLLTIGRRTLQNDRIDCDLDALLTAGILKMFALMRHFIHDQGQIYGSNRSRDSST